MYDEPNISTILDFSFNLCRLFLPNDRGVFIALPVCANRMLANSLDETAVDVLMSLLFPLIVYKNIQLIFINFKFYKLSSTHIFVQRKSNRIDEVHTRDIFGKYHRLHQYKYQSLWCGCTIRYLEALEFRSQTIVFRAKTVKSNNINYLGFQCQYSNTNKNQCKY